VVAASKRRQRVLASIGFSPQPLVRYGKMHFMGHAWVRLPYMQKLSRSCASGDLPDKQGLHYCNNAYMHRAGFLTVLGYAAWGGKKRIWPNACSALVEFCTNGNSRSLQYMEDFRVRIATVFLSFKLGRRHFSATWLRSSTCKRQASSHISRRKEKSVERRTYPRLHPFRKI
jgi:hypothetical protein